MNRRFASLALAFVACVSMNAQDLQLVLDDNAGNLATINVIAGVAAPTCVGACALGVVYTPGPSNPEHGQLIVSGTLGQFTLNVTGQGGGFTPGPTHQNLNEIDATSTGPGTLTVLFTDTDYTTFGNPFFLTGSGTFSAGIQTSETDFQAFMDPANTIPASILIGEFLNVVPTICVGPNCSFAVAGSFPNPTGSQTGSLTTIKNINFSGIGSAQISFTIGSVPTAVPEPSSVVLFAGVMFSTVIGMRRKFGRQW